MLKRFNCIFVSSYLEKQFRNSQIPKNKSQFTTFALQLNLFLVFYAIYYIQKQAHIVEILGGCGGAIALVIIIKCVVDKYPLKIDFLLLIIQAIMAAIQSIDSIVEVDSDDRNDGNLNFDWFYGYLFSYKEACLLQGYSFIYQSIGLLGVFTFYVARYPAYTAEFFSVCISFLSLIVGIIYMKYQQEIAKRTQFCENRERMKWNNMIDDMIDESIIIIKMDKSQDQLMIHQMNTTAKKNLQISNDQQMRTFIRNLKAVKREHITIEKIIREILMNPEKINQKETEKIDTIEQDKKYEVNILNYWMEQQLMVIMIIKGVQDIQIQKEKEVIKQILANCLDNIYRLLHNKSKYRIDVFNPIITFYFIKNYFFGNTNNRINLKYFRINTYSIKLSIMKYFSTSLQIIFSRDSYINSNIDIINYIIVSLIQLNQTDQSKIFLKIQQLENSILQSSIEISIKITNFKYIQQDVKKFIRMPLDFKHISGSLESFFIDLLNSLQSLPNSKTRLNLINIKYLLQIFGNDNKIEIQKRKSFREIKFRIIDLKAIND